MTTIGGKRREEIKRRTRSNIFLFHSSTSSSSSSVSSPFSSSHSLPVSSHQDLDPLNQTLSFQEGEELKLRDWSEARRGWSHRTPQTLLDELANLDINNSAAIDESEQGAGPLRSRLLIGSIALFII